MTLDISAAADYNRLGPKKTKKKKPTTPPPGAQDSVEPPETTVLETPAPIDIEPTLEQPEEDLSLSEPPDRVQILDLHTHNPLISYRNQLYSCEWTSTLGTDVILTAPQPDFPHPILREKPNVFVLATSSIKLMGQPVQIASRQGNEAGAPASTLAHETPPTDPAEPPPVKIPLGETPSRARQNQANFLERLIAIKAKKGERDNVTVYSQKTNQGSGWRSQRKASEAFEDDDDDDGEGEPAPKQSARGRGKGSGGRPKGSRRTIGPRTAKGGLFRDYRPQLWDKPGADIRAGPSSTPERWSQLEEGGASEGRQITTSPAPADRASKIPRSPSPSTLAITSPTPPSPHAQPTNNLDNTTSIVGNAAPSPPSAPQPDKGRTTTSRDPDIEMEHVQ